MGNTEWAQLWHIVTAMLARQTPFVQVLAVTLAVLFVVMALEGFRASLLAIGRGHKPPAPPPRASASSPETAPTAHAAGPTASRSFAVTPRKPRTPRPKPLAQPPRQFRSPRPMIRRQNALLPPLG
jgi:hypothetical protein